MTGTFLNAGAIVVFALYALISGRQFTIKTQNFWRMALGAATAFLGLRLVWISVEGPPLAVLRQLGLLMLALILGRLLGRLLRLQKVSNRLGRVASARIEAAVAKGAGTPDDGFKTCSVLFCAAPLAILGAITDGLSGQFQALVVKALMDGLAAAAFVPAFRWGVVLSAVPVLAYQGTIALASQAAAPWLAGHHLLNPINAAAGLLISFVSLIIFETMRVEIADYLPTLAVAPVLFALLG